MIRLAVPAAAVVMALAGVVGYRVMSPGDDERGAPGDGAVASGLPSRRPGPAASPDAAVEGPGSSGAAAGSGGPVPPGNAGDATGSSVDVVPGHGPDPGIGPGGKPAWKAGGTHYGDWDFSKGLPRGWTAVGEAQRLFEPLRLGFEAAPQPLSDEHFRAVVRAHRGQSVEAFKEAGALGQAGFPQEGRDLLAAWDAQYRSWQDRVARAP